MELEVSVRTYQAHTGAYQLVHTFMTSNTVTAAARTSSATTEAAVAVVSVLAVLAF